MSALKVIGVVLTLNEQIHLDECLASLSGLATRTIVLDSGSTDRTLEIARAHDADVVHIPFRGFASQRNEGLRLAGEHGWVLFLDADERLTPELCTEIRAALDSVNPDIAGFWIPRTNIAFDRVLRGGGWWPDHQARLIRAGHACYDASREVHEVVEFDGTTACLKHPMVHLNYNSRREFMLKQRAYTLRAVRHSDGPAPRVRAYVGRPLREFWRRFVVLHGYRDRIDGLFMATVMALEEVRACRLLRKRSSP